MPAAQALSALPRPRGEQTAERILDAAEALFAERGYDGASLRHVAERVGIRTPSLYNHFDSKQSLYAAVLERGLGPAVAALGEFAETASGAQGDPRRMIERVMGLLAQRPALPRLILHETLSGGQRLTPMLRGWIAPTLSRAREMIERNPAARGWESEQIPLLVLALYHAVMGSFTLSPLLDDAGGAEPIRPPDLEQQTRFLADLVGRLLPETPPGPVGPAHAQE